MGMTSLCIILVVFPWHYPQLINDFKVEVEFEKVSKQHIQTTWTSQTEQKPYDTNVFELWFLL